MNLRLPNELQHLDVIIMGLLVGFKAMALEELAPSTKPFKDYQKVCELQACRIAVGLGYL